MGFATYEACGGGGGDAVVEEDAAVSQQVIARPSSSRAAAVGSAVDSSKQQGRRRFRTSSLSVASSGSKAAGRTSSGSSNGDENIAAASDDDDDDDDDDDASSVCSSSTSSSTSSRAKSVCAATEDALRQQQQQRRRHRAAVSLRRRVSCASSTLSCRSSGAFSRGAEGAPAAAPPQQQQQQQLPQLAPQQPDQPVINGVTRRGYSITTADGWRLYLHRAAADAGMAHGAAAAAAAAANAGDGAEPAVASAAAPNRGRRRRRFPVLLVPGLAAGGVETFDLDPTRSLAQHLAEAGYDVWAPDLRGNGRSDKPRFPPFGRRASWTVDDHLHLDVPAVVGAVLAATGAPKLHWVGHSMGGMLAVGSLSRDLEATRGALASVTLVASGCFGAGSWHGLAAPVLTRLARFGVPARELVAALSSLRGPLAPVAYVTRALFYVAAGVDAAVGRRLLAGPTLSWIPRAVVAQFLGTLNSNAGLAASDGAFLYADPAALARDTTTPVLAVSGSCDRFCPAAGALRTLGLFGGAHRRFLLLGPEYGTASAPYGHFCPLIARRAAAEVFPHVSAFISEFDGGQRQRLRPSSIKGGGRSGRGSSSTSTSTTSSGGRAVELPPPYRGDGEGEDDEVPDAGEAVAAP